jgi:hypothetical protein
MPRVLKTVLNTLGKADIVFDQSDPHCVSFRICKSGARFAGHKGNINWGRTPLYDSILPLWEKGLFKLGGKYVHF